MLTQKEEQSLKRFKAILKDRFGSEIKSVFLFGSKARGDSHRDSDIDVLVITRHETWELKEDIGRIATKILLADAVYLSVKVFGDRTFRRLKRLRSPFLRNIAKEGILL